MTYRPNRRPLIRLAMLLMSVDARISGAKYEAEIVRGDGEVVLRKERPKPRDCTGTPKEA